MTPLSPPAPLHDFLIIRRAEGAAIGIVATLIFAQISANWWLFCGLLLLPDIAMLGYVAGPQIGAFTYNLAHTYVLPGIVAVIGVVVDLDALTILSTIWCAHIGIDRAFGYGLKHATGFKHTHLSGVSPS